jgi:glycine C-acetyltransferase
LIVIEGVYGMRGDLADLKGICELKNRYEARLFVDDAHGFGVMGEHGRGLGEHFGVQDKIDLYFGTFAKAFAAIGGVTAGEEEVVRYIKYNARTNVFAKSLPMIYVDALEASLNLIQNHPEYRERMWQVAKRLQAGLMALGYDIGDTKSPITPVYVPAGSEQTVMSMMKMLREDYGVFVSGVSYPVVPRGVVMCRMIPTASHSDEDVDLTVEAFKKMRDRMKLDLSKKPSLRNR